MSLTKIGSIGINTGIAFAGVTTIVTLNTANDALSIGATVNVGSGITLGASGDIFATGVSTFSGNLKVGSGVTISPDGDGFYTGVVTATTFSGALAASSLTGALPAISAANLTNVPAANITGTLPAISGANLTNLDASDLASGTVPTARLGSGTASSSTFLRGDSTFATVTSTTINNNADNRVITGSGTANTLVAESGLVYNGYNLAISGTGQQQLNVGSTDAGGAAIVLDGDSNGDGSGGDYSLIRHNTDGDLEFLARSTGGATNTIFKQGTSEKLRIDSNGNMGLGITPSAHSTTSSLVKSLQIGTVTNLYNESSDDYTILGNNIYYNGTNNKRIKAQECSRLMMNAGELTFQRAGADSADSNITFSTHFKIDSNGNAFVENASEARLQVKTPSNGIIALRADGTNTQLGTWSNHDLKIVRNSTIKASITSDGLCFNSDTAAANALDDYEEGAWTVSLISGGTSIAEGGSGNNRYVKIGSMVFLTFEIGTLSNPDGNTFEVGNLPYTVASSREGTGSCMSNHITYGTNRTMITTYAYSGQTKLRFYTSGNATNWRAITGSDFTVSGSIIGTIAYHTV